MPHRTPVLLTAVVLMAVCAGGCQSVNDTVNDTNEWRQNTLVPGSPIRSPNGIEFGPDGKLYAGSVGSKTIYRIDVKTREVDIVVPAPLGEADDLAFAPDGTLVWTALVAGEIRALRADGTAGCSPDKSVLINSLNLASTKMGTRPANAGSSRVSTATLIVSRSPTTTC